MESNVVESSGVCWQSTFQVVRRLMLYHWQLARQVQRGGDGEGSQRQQLKVKRRTMVAHCGVVPRPGHDMGDLLERGCDGGVRAFAKVLYPA